MIERNTKGQFAKIDKPVKAAEKRAENIERIEKKTPRFQKFGRRF